MGERREFHQGTGDAEAAALSDRMPGEFEGPDENVEILGPGVLQTLEGMLKRLDALEAMPITPDADGKWARMVPVEGGADGTDKMALLYGALAKAQGEIGGAARDRLGQVGQQKYHYATLSSVRNAMQAPFAKNGLAVIQRLDTSELSGQVRVTTQLVHEGGGMVSDCFTVPYEVTKGINALQAMGTAITYARRYALMAVAGVASDDEDGTGAGPTPEQREQQTQQAQDALADVTELILKAPDEDALVALCPQIKAVPKGEANTKGWKFFEARCKELELDPRETAKKGGAM